MHVALARLFALLAVCSSLYKPTGCISPTWTSSMVKGQRTVLDMRGKHHVSQRALSHICKDIKLNGMVEATSTRTILRNRQALVNRDTPFGKLIQERSLVTKKGGAISIPFLHPAAMLWACCQDCNEFKMFFSSVLEGQPRLKMVQYTDEVTPGRELLAYNSKKFWAFYWSFLDFGPTALANENAWFTGVVVRSHTVRNKIAGGIGQIFKVYNKMFFSEGFDFRKGILLNVPRSPAASAQAHDFSLVFADLKMVVQDAEAHALAFNWKGAGSTKCCPLCYNVVSKNCNMVLDPTGTTIPVYTTDTSRFKLTSNKTFRAMQNRLKDFAMHHTQTALASKEQDFGFKYNPHSWLQDEGLDVKPMEVIAFDIMHCWCQKGVWEIEFGACMESLSKHRHGGRQLHAYMKRFMWPGAYASGSDICKGSVQERAENKDVKPAGSASEFMSACPVVRKWVEDVVKPAGICRAQVESLLRCMDVMDLLSQCDTGRVTPSMLADAMAIHYAAHVLAYGHTLFVPKHHYMLHIPAQLEKFKILVQCYVHERKHKILKRWAAPMCPKKDNNRSLLEECTVAHLNSLQDPLLKPCLLEPVKASPNVVAALKEFGFSSAGSALTGRTARVQGRAIQIGDVVLYWDSDNCENTLVGETYFFANIGGELLVGLSAWPVKKDLGRYRKVVVEENFSIIPFARLLQAMIFTPTDVGKIATVIMPVL